jgi:hypothetical protein
LVIRVRGTVRFGYGFEAVVMVILVLVPY